VSISSGTPQSSKKRKRSESEQQQGKHKKQKVTKPTPTDETQKKQSEKQSDIVDEDAMDVDIACNIPSPRRQNFETIVNEMFRKQQDKETLSVKQITEAVNQDNSNPYSEKEINILLKQMDDEGKVMLCEGNVHLL